MNFKNLDALSAKSLKLLYNFNFWKTLRKCNRSVASRENLLNKT